MVQDRVFYAESLAQVVSLDTENKHRLSNPDSHSSHIAMLFDGSTIPPKRRLVSEMPEDHEGFRAKYEIIANVGRMMKLRSPDRAVLVWLTENTWETHHADYIVVKVEGLFKGDRHSLHDGITRALPVWVRASAWVFRTSSSPRFPGISRVLG